jgi:curli biogenesis system outer membrane secretion channel CsgG
MEVHMRSLRAVVVLAFVVAFALPAFAATKVYVAAGTPAQVKLPEGLKRIAIVQFTAKDSLSQPYAGIAAARLNSVLAATPDCPFQLLDRTHMKGVLAEQDLGASGVTDSDTAIKAGKMLNVDAIIFGSVHAEKSEEVAHNSSGGITKSVPYVGGIGGGSPSVRRSALVNVTFNMVHPETGEQLVTRSISRSYDSDKGGSPLKGVFPGGKTPSGEAIVNDLIEQCVAEFAGLIVAHFDTYEYTLASSSKTKTGNTFAEGGDIKTAAAQYKLAMEADPKDSAAVFNLAIASLALNDPQAATTLLDKAVMLKTDKKWIQVRQQVAELTKAEGVQFRPATTSEIATYKSSLKNKD